MVKMRRAFRDRIENAPPRHDLTGGALGEEVLLAHGGRHVEHQYRDILVVDGEAEGDVLGVELAEGVGPPVGGLLGLTLG